jgi:hypothetical protein
MIKSSLGYSISPYFILKQFLSGEAHIKEYYLFIYKSSYYISNNPLDETLMVLITINYLLLYLPRCVQSVIALPYLPRCVQSVMVNVKLAINYDFYIF